MKIKFKHYGVTVSFDIGCLSGGSGKVRMQSDMKVNMIKVHEVEWHFEYDVKLIQVQIFVLA
jgi:hypothetical protein